MRLKIYAFHREVSPNFVEKKNKKSFSFQYETNWKTQQQKNEFILFWRNLSQIQIEQ